MLAATPVPSSASRSTTVSSVDEVDNGNGKVFEELQTTFQRATIFGCNNLWDPSATAETTFAQSLVSLQSDERVCRRPRMFCTHCGARVLVRCEEPHCLRGPCCQPNPACPLCSDNEPVPTSALPPPSPPASPPPPPVVRGPSALSVPLRLPALSVMAVPRAVRREGAALPLLPTHSQVGRAPRSRSVPLRRTSRARALPLLRSAPPPQSAVVPYVPLRLNLSVPWASPRSPPH